MAFKAIHALIPIHFAIPLVYYSPHFQLPFVYEIRLVPSLLRAFVIVPCILEFSIPSYYLLGSLSFTVQLYYYSSEQSSLNQNIN